jgi:uncharacterized protein YyaL (SSP411 family)
MFGNLVLLSHLTGNPIYEEMASRHAEGFAGIVRLSPSAYCTYLCALDHLLGPAADVVIAGRGTDPAAGEMVRWIQSRYLPTVTIHLRTPITSPALDTLAPFTRAMTTQDGKPAAYVCTGRTCSPAILSPDRFRQKIS